MSFISGALRYYLSAGGIIGEADGQMLERTIEQGIVSQFLNNFDNLDISVKKRMVGAYLPTEQKALFCLNDTTYVYDEKAIRYTGGQGGWSTWGLSFAGGCLYDVEDELDFTPGKTFYFFKPGDSALYSFGTSQTDDGDSIRIEWKSGAIAASRYKSQVYDVGLWVNSQDAGDSTLAVYVIDENRDTVSTGYLSELNTKRYHLKELLTNENHYFNIYIVSNKSVTNTIIDGIDIRFETVATPEIE